MSFGRRLQHERTSRGWTQEQLAAASGVSAAQIARIEHDRVPASEQAMALLLAALKVDSDSATPAANAAAPLPESVAPPVAAAPVPAPAPQPVALHVPADLLAQLEAAALADGRTLHGEILARLAASFAGSTQASTSLQPQPPAPTAHAPVTWAPQDLERLTALIAQRLRGA